MYSSGGGIFNTYNATVNISNSTLVDNTAGTFGSGEVFTTLTIPAPSLVTAPYRVIHTLNGVTRSTQVKTDGIFSIEFATDALAVGAYDITYDYAGPIKLELADAKGADASSSSILVSAISLVRYKAPRCLSCN